MRGELESNLLKTSKTYENSNEQVSVYLSDWFAKKIVSIRKELLINKETVFHGDSNKEKLNSHIVENSLKYSDLNEFLFYLIYGLNLHWGYEDFLIEYVVTGSVPKHNLIKTDTQKILIDGHDETTIYLSIDKGVTRKEFDTLYPSIKKFLNSPQELGARSADDMGAELLKRSGYGWSGHERSSDKELAELYDTDIDSIKKRKFREKRKYNLTKEDKNGTKK